MPSVAAILKVSAVVFLVCGFLTTVPAQLPEPQPRKLDEFGRVGHCDLTARLDNLAMIVLDNPGTSGHIISYAPPGAGERLLELIKEYLITRGLDPKQIGTTYGGRNSDLIEPKIELWVVPRNAPLPEPREHKTSVETFRGLLADERREDDFGIEIVPEMGPGIGRTTYAAFADLLDQQPNAIGYVVIYSGEDATPGEWRRIAQHEMDYFKNQNFDTSRIKVIFGGHKKNTRRQLWVLPKDAPPPVRDAGPERPLAKTVKVRDFYAYDLGNEQTQTNLFARLKEILNAQKTLRAFVVVRLEVPIRVEDAEPVIDVEPIVDVEPLSEPVEEREPADLSKLVEKWRVELANTHKIGADRFIVLFTTASEVESSHLSLWIVPKGQPFPDPNKEDENPEADPE